MRVRELPDQPRLADAGLADHRHELAVALARSLQRLAQHLDFRVATHEAREPTRRRGLQPTPHRAHAGQLEDLDWRREPLYRHGTARGDLDEAFGQGQRLRSQQDRAGLGHLLHARGQVRALTDCRVVHVQVGADRPDHDVTRVQPHANLDRYAEAAKHALGVTLHRLLHPKRRVARAHRVILVGDGGAEQRHDPVAHHLIDGALVTVHGLHHVLEHGVEKLARLLGVAVGEQLHRALEVGEQHGDLLALAFEGGLRGEDLLGEVLGGVRLGGREAQPRC